LIYKSTAVNVNKRFENKLGENGSFPALGLAGLNQ
tara:strand:+ start:386 stop:490 length:105 start_codon:yes stop_codon:yes gene_type:complete